MGYCIKWIHPAFKDALKHRPRTDSKQIIFPWNLENNRFSFSEFSPSYRPHLGLGQAQTTISKLQRSIYYNPEMKRVNNLLSIASCIGCVNCIILPLLLFLLMTKSISTAPFTVLGIFGILFCLTWCACSACILAAAYKDIKTLEERRNDFQRILDRENLAHFHKFGKSWQVGPFGSYLQYNLDKLYFEGQRGVVFKEEVPMPMSSQRGVYDSGYV